MSEAYLLAKIDQCRGELLAARKVILRLHGIARRHATGRPTPWDYVDTMVAADDWLARNPKESDDA